MERRDAEDDEGWLLTYADLVTNLLVFFVMLLSVAEISESRLQQIKQQLSGETSPTSLKAIQQQVEDRIRAADLQDLVLTELTDAGLQVSLNSGLVFDSGGDEIKPDFEAPLASMLDALVRYSDRYRFAVEGHTDSQPIHNGRYPSNWELSTARAHAVRARLQSVGIPSERIRVEGYADTRPLPQDALEGLNEADRLARHRRVVVRVY